MVTDKELKKVVSRCKILRNALHTYRLVMHETMNVTFSESSRRRQHPLTADEDNNAAAATVHPTRIASYLRLPAAI